MSPSISVTRIVELDGKFHVQHQIGKRHEIWIPKSWHHTVRRAEEAKAKLEKKIEAGLL